MIRPNVETRIRHTRQLVLGSALAACLLAAPVTAHAQQTTDPANKKEAEAQFQEGYRLISRGDYARARPKLEAAFRLVKRSTTITYYLALAEIKVNDRNHPEYWAQGLRHLRLYMRLQQEEQKRAGKPAPDPDDSRYIGRANAELIPEALNHVGELTIETTPTAIVSIDGVDLTSDERVVQAPIPDPVAVTPGAHHVESRIGSDKAAKDIDVRAGQTLNVSLPLERSSTAAAAPTPTKTTASSPEKAVTNEDLDAMLDRSGSAPRTSNSAHYVVPAVLAGGALLALGAGVFFGSKSKSAKDDAEDIRSAQTPGACTNASAPRCADLRDAVDSQNKNQAWSIGMYVGAGALAGAAVLTWFLIPSEREVRSTASPMVGPGLVGANWTTRF